jgi:hypothetical protein
VPSDVIKRAHATKKEYEEQVRGNAEDHDHGQTGGASPQRASTPAKIQGERKTEERNDKTGSQ